jgi:hypothetical protein
LLLFIHYADAPIQLEEGEACGAKADNLVRCGSSPQSMKEESELVLQQGKRTKFVSSALFLLVVSRPVRFSTRYSNCETVKIPFYTSSCPSATLGGKTLLNEEQKLVAALCHVSLAVS